MQTIVLATQRRAARGKSTLAIRPCTCAAIRAGHNVRLIETRPTPRGTVSNWKRRRPMSQRPIVEPIYAARGSNSACNRSRTTGVYGDDRGYRRRRDRR